MIKTGGYFLFLLYICLLCDEILLSWKFGNPGFDVRVPQDPPNMNKITKNEHFFTLGPIYYKNWRFFFFLLYICLLCDEVLLPWKFGNPGFDVRVPQDPPPPPQIYKNIYIFYILDFNFKSSFQIVSLFHMYIDMSEMIAGDQDRLSLIIECPPPPPPAPEIAKNIHFGPDMKDWFSINIVFP